MEINRLHVDFDLQSKYEPKGDQVNAIAELTEGLNNGEKYQTLLGATGTGKTFTIANIVKNFSRTTELSISFHTTITSNQKHMFHQQILI